MNFQKWLKVTKGIEEIGKGTKSSIDSLLIVERCRSLRDMLDESLESILTAEEFMQFRTIEGKHIMLSLLRSVREANDMLKHDSELDDED